MNTAEINEIPDENDTVSYLGYWVNEKAKLEEKLAAAIAEIEKSRRA